MLRRIFILLCLTLSVQSQSNNNIPNLWNLSFSKQSLSWDWNGRLKYQFLSPQKYGVKLNDQFSSNLVSSNIAQKPWRDEHRLNGFAFRDSETNRLGIYFNSWFLSDRQKKNNSEFSDHSLGVRTEWKPGSGLEVNPYLGYQRAQNNALVEWGWDLGMNSRAERFQMGDYQGNARGSIHYDFFQERKNRAYDLSLNVNTDFSAVSSDSFAVYLSDDSKQYFQLQPKQLIDLNISEKGLFNRLDYRVAQRQKLEINTILKTRKVADDRRGDQNRRQVDHFENRFSYLYAGNDFFFAGRLHTWQENQDNLGLETDSKAMQTSVQANIQYNISDFDKISANFGFVKFEYNTPDSSKNHDDRDEQRYLATLRYKRIFSPIFSAWLEAYLNFYHQIYIFKEQSANNNWNRILQLKTGAEYRYKSVRNTTTAELLANFTEYDFEEYFTSTRSFIFRKLIIADSVELPIYSGLSGGFYGRLELEDKGSFFAKDFAERIVLETKSWYYDLYISKKLFLLLQFEGGITVYSRKDWQHIPIKKVSRDISSVSPYLRLKYDVKKRLTCYAYLERTFLNDKGRQKTRYYTGRLRMIYQF